MKEPLRQFDEGIWSELGNHGGRITILENDRYAAKQDFVNHRAETLSIFKEIRTEIHELVKPVVTDIAHIKKFMYLGIGGFMTLSAVFTFIINFDKFKAFFGH